MRRKRLDEPAFLLRHREVLIMLRDAEEESHASDVAEPSAPVSAF